MTQGEKDEMLLKLKSKKVELTSWKVNKDRMTDLTPKLRAFTAESEEIKGMSSLHSPEIHGQKNGHGRGWSSCYYCKKLKFWDRLEITLARKIAIPAG